MFLKATQAVRGEGPAVVNSNTGTIKCGMIGAAANGRPLGVPLKHDVRTARILVIEDNVSDVFLLDRALNKQDFSFELVHLLNGADAIAFCRRLGAYEDAAIPDLILMDLNLSKYSGEDLLREIRAAGHLAGIPVCVWSSSQSRRDEALLKSLGVCQFITKPSGLDQFMEIGKSIKDLLAGPRPA
jgi:two-component system, chemotaxis family, response regulator Rcp1